MGNKSFEEEISDFENELKREDKRQRQKKLKSCFYCRRVHDKRVMERFKFKYRCMDCSEKGIEKRMIYKERTCNICRNKFITSNITKNGIPQITNRRKCDTCQNKKKNKGKLPGPKFIYAQCDICGKTVDNKAKIYNHMDHHRSDVCCRVCGAKFTARSALRGHLRTHFEKFICELCGYTTNRIETFRIHNKLHAGIPIPKSTKIYPKKPVLKGEFPCSICGIMYTTKIGLVGHERRQHSNEGINGFSCKICGHVTYRLQEYRMHALTHSTRPLLFCHYPGCNIYYDRLKRLNNHIRNVHTNDKKFTCQHCGKTFRYKASVEKHLTKNSCKALKTKDIVKNKFSKKMQKLETKSPEELERIAKIAKQQYLEVRGSSKVFEPEKLSESEGDILDAENNNKIETILTDAIDIEEEPIDYHEQLNDCLDVLPENHEYKDVIKIEDNDIDTGTMDLPFVKVEIKTEPDIDTTINSVVQYQESSLFYTAVENVKIDTEYDDKKMALSNPFVLIEKLDYDTISKWVKVKTEEEVPKLKRLSKKVTFGKFKHKGSKYECDLCGYQNINKKEMRNHLYKHKLRYLKRQCNYCKTMFPTLTLLSNHIRNVHNTVQEPSEYYFCEVCNKRFPALNNLRTHMKFVHSILQFQCDICSCVFKCKSHIQRHIEDVHLQIQRFSCSICGKSFKRKQPLKVHEFRHSILKERCNLCGKRVKLMKEHMINAHSNNKKEAELIVCTYCGKTCPKSSIKGHIERIHLKILPKGKSMRNCLKCDQTFTRVDDLRRHEILQHFEGVIKRCPYDCDAIFKKTKPLNIHIKNAHIRNKIHQCEICSKTFNTRSGLLKHRKMQGHKPDETEDKALQ